MNLSCLCIWGKSWICLGLDHILNIGSHLALTDSTDLHNLGADDLRLFLAKIWENRLLKHRDQLVRRSRKKNGSLTVFLKDQTRRCTVVVIKHNSAFRNLRLLIIIGGHTSVRMILLIFLHIALNTLTGMRIFRKRKSHYLSTYFLSQIILSWSETSRKNYHVRSVEGRCNHSFHSVVIISHNRLIVNRKSQLGTFLRKICAVGVYNISQQNFSSYSYKFCNHIYTSFPEHV